MEKNQKKTILPRTADNAVTATGMPSAYDPCSESVVRRVEKWYLDPLRKMGTEHGLILLTLLFPLYEKYLRVACKLKFHKDRTFEIIGEHLDLSPDEALLFWTNMRHGLLHRAVPNEFKGFRYAIHQVGQPVELVDGVFWINPRALRDCIFNIIEPEVAMWDEDDFKLPLVYLRTDD